MKASVVSRVGVTFLAVYAVYSTGLFCYEALDYWQKNKQERTVSLLMESKLSHELLKNGQDKLVEERLRGAFESQAINGYILVDKGVVTKSAGLDKDAVRKLLAIPPGFLWQSPGAESVLVATPDKAAVLFIWQSKGFYFKKLLSKSRGKLLSDILFVALFALALVLYEFRDYFKILGILRNNKRSRLGELKAVSREGALLASALKGYEHELRSAQEEKLLYKNQLLPALRSELESGLSAPYEFHCTMVRTDINGFSTIFNRYPRAPFMELINEFFLECTHIVSRYEGFVAEFAGDEIIYYFKQQGALRSEKLALAAVREIGDAAERFHERCSRERGYSFRVKSAMASGVLRFGKLVNHMGLAGAPFIETVRLLSAVTEKERNSIVIPGRMRGVFQAFAEFESLGTAVLKGYDEAVELLGFRSLTPYRFYLEHLAVGADYADISYRRSDAEVAGLFAFLSAKRGELGEDRVLRGLSLLRKVPFTKISPDLKDAFLSFAETLPAAGKLFSALIGFAPLLFTKDDRDLRLERLIERAIGSQDHRTVANAIEALMHFRPDSPLSRPFLRSADHRVSAAALVKRARSGIDSVVVDGLAAKLASGKAPETASGLYAVGEIAAYWNKQDPIYLSTRLAFVKIMESVAGYMGHKNEMVARQAAVALQKCAAYGAAVDRKRAA